ncbi:centrosome-associated protein 350-like isoform X2 [Homalodisca vitripennis]|uniref:centrosome-associated protein 350-like isoform X2 n=1 Tax=Homalodisca vitripennis TaxID=197043 RepID=UPI001EE9F169|nr:centrosome-associated protein 350-like isoform X2 [Homalodisca vitripennis]
MDSSRRSTEENTNSSQSKFKNSQKAKVKMNNPSLNQPAKKPKKCLGVGRTASCSELPTQPLKTDSCSDLTTKTLFFNEKGWPVKVMRLTENSPPKPLKPWPTRSLPSTTSNKSPRKSKSLYTQKNPAIAKSSKENKENKECADFKERSTSTERNIETVLKPVETEGPEEVPVLSVHGLDTELKLVLDQLDDTMGKLSSEKDKQADNDTKIPMRKSTTKLTKPTKFERKPPKSEPKESLCSARSNKYDSKEMKAYIQAKRTERKLQMSEEMRKKQEMMALQRKNLEKLKEKACQVLKKSSTKTIEENKPRWQGPLEEDHSEESPAAICIFDSKIPTARKSKLNLKTDRSESNNQTYATKQDEDVGCDNRESEETKKLNVSLESVGIVESIEEITGDKMEKERRSKAGSGKMCKKLRLSRNKLSADYPKVLSSLQKAANQQALKTDNVRMNDDHLPHTPGPADDGKQCQVSTDKPLSLNPGDQGLRPDNVKMHIDDLRHSPADQRAVDEWKHYNLICTDNNQPMALNHESRRSTFNISHPMLPTPHSHQDFSERKCQTLSPVKSPCKKICSSETITSPHESPVQHNLMENALKKVQEEVLLNQKEGKNPEWLQSFLKPDGLNMMNVIQMKGMLSNQKRESSESEKNGRLKQKVISGRCSLEDETDAPSIISMEDFQILPEPLRLSDLHLPIPNKSSTEESLASTIHSSPINSATKRTQMKMSMKTTSSFTSEAEPLVIPESVQQLKLRSKRRHSETSDSQPLQNSMDSVRTTTTSSADQPKPMSPVISSSSSKVSLKDNTTPENKPTGEFLSEPHLNLNNGQIEIGQVLSSSALLLQFHLELSRLDAFDQSLAQVIAAERLYQTPTHAQLHSKTTSDQLTFVSGPGKTSSAHSGMSEPVQARRKSPHVSGSSQTINSSSVSDLVRTSHVNMSLPDRNSRSSQPTSVSEHLTTDQRVQSGESDASSGRVYSHSQSDQLVFEHLPTLVTKSLESLHRSAPSSLHSVEEMSLTLEESTQEEEPVSEKSNPPVTSVSVLAPSFSPKNLRFLQVLIDEAEFQKKQHEFLYKTQEDSLRTNYKVALTELDSGFRGLVDSHMGPLNKENDIRAKIEKHYKTTISNIRDTRNHVLSNWNKRIEELSRERDILMKQTKKPSPLKLRSSAEASPKKLTPLRSSSATSIVESSSSEESVVTQTFEDKKRQENDKEKVVLFNRKKVEKELLKKVREEMRKVQELEKSERLLKTGRSRRDKSTSPLESVLEASTRDVGCSVRDDNESVSQLATSSLHSVEEARATDVYNSESFESPESSETPRQPRMFNRPSLASKPFVAARLNNKSKVLIKVPLSPRLQMGNKHRCSSGSDESLLLSQNETQSEQSDYEVRISALKEQKRQRYAELSRLQRELKRAQKEQLKATEASLLKQIQVYDSYIDQTKKQLAEVSATNAVRPQIKHPRLSDRFLPRNSDILKQKSAIEDQSKLETPASDVDTNSLKSVSEAASSTDTTIQSSGVLPPTEQSSPKTEVNNEGSNDAMSAESEVAEVFSSLSPETVNITDVPNSNVSEVSDEVKEVLKSSASDFHDVSDSNGENQWMDAVDFFEQLGNPDETVTHQSNGSKLSIEEHFSSTTSKTDTNKILNGSLQIISKDHSVEEEIDNEHKIISQSSTTTPEEHLSSSKHELIDSKSTEELITQITEENKSENLDIGSVVSIISQAPSSVTSKSANSLGQTDNDIESVVHNSVSEVKSDDNNDLSDSITISEKLNLSQVVQTNSSSQSAATSISSDVVISSQHSSEGDGNSLISQPYSEVDDHSEASQSETVIKVVMSTKNQVSNEEDKEVDMRPNLNETFKIISKSEEIKSTIDHCTVDKITDDILSGLLSECVKFNREERQIQNETHEELQNSNENVCKDKDASGDIEEVLVDDFTTTVLNKFLQDATDCMLKIKESKQTSSVCFNSNTVDKSVEGRQSNLLEALAVEGYNRRSSSSAYEDNFSLSASKTAEVEFNDGHEGEVFWFDEDLHPVSLQTQREAEELRIKQLQIEQEIKQLEQAQENIPSYYYVREIPNKPPPPYTPPGQSKEPAPARQEDIESMVTMAVQSLGAVWLRGEDLSTIQPSEQYSSTHVGNHTYKKFLFDLVRQVLVDIPTNREDETDTPPWERAICRVRRLVVPKLTEETVTGYVLKKVRILFGFEPNAIKESLIIQWSRKKRDRVDELLVRDSQEEEQEWTDYSKCEVSIKNTMALSIFDSLIEETTLVLNSAFEKKMKHAQEEKQEKTDYSKCEVAVKNTIALSIFDSLIEETTLVLNSAFEKKMNHA